MRSIMSRKPFAGRGARFALQAAAVLSAAAIMGCATNPYPPAPQIAASPDYLYKIGPGDSLSVNVWRNPEISASVPVRPDGKMTAPLIEDLPAMGKDPTTLARDIEKALSYIRDPVVTVIVGGSLAPIQSRIRVLPRRAKAAGATYRRG
jgi:polysaccharide export outer membrane protein